MFDVIIIGAGPASVGAIRQLVGLNVAVLDVGMRVGAERPAPGFYTDEIDAKAMLGGSFETIAALMDGVPPLTPKLKSPNIRPTVGELGYSSLVSSNFEANRSYAFGGLANAWGAQLYRYDSADMTGWPIAPSDLAPYYEELENHIGIAGCNDDLAQFYGHANHLLPALPLIKCGQRLDRQYRRYRSILNRGGLYLGRPRLGVLTEDHNGRTAHQFRSMEFFEPNGGGIYCPRQDLEQFIKDGKVTYISGAYVTTFESTSSNVVVTYRDVATDNIHVVHGKRLLLAAGCIESTKIVANSLYRGASVTTPIVENLLSYTPFVSPRDLGNSIEQRAFYAQQNLMFVDRASDQCVQGTFYAIRGVLHADLLRDLPLSIASNISAMRYLANAMLVLHLWYPCRSSPGNSLTVSPSGDILVDFQSRVSGDVEARLIAKLRKLGLYSIPQLCKFPAPGNSFHYVGTMPMAINPGPMQTDVNGRVFGCDRVYVVDGACIPSLSAKNHSLTIMANASRIADHLRQTNSLH